MEQHKIPSKIPPPTPSSPDSVEEKPEEPLQQAPTEHHEEGKQEPNTAEGTLEPVEKQPVSTSMAQQDDTPPKGKSTEVESKQQEGTEAPQSSWGWGWGSIGSMLTSSVSAVSDSAQSLGKGIGSIVTNVEGALGVPQPEEMIREPSKEEEKEEQQESKDSSRHCHDL